jgi:metal-responsive CopG/Arc/MetJ family transcriptional regulator
MAGIKTAISLEKGLLEQINKYAKEMNVSRSKFFSIAVKGFIERLQNQHMLDKLNFVYDEPGKDEDVNILKAHRNNQKQILKEDPWEE